MKNKKRSVFLTLALASLLVLGACGSRTKKESSNVSSSESQTSESESITSSESSESSSSSSEEKKKEYIVRFLVEGKVVKAYTVKEGELAEYTGDEPTKEPDESAVKYGFRGWDKDITQPITENTDFNAVFSGYASELVIDDFESYDGNGDLVDAGWGSMTFDNSSKTWTYETNAAVSVGQRAEQGEKSLRFDAWANNCDYKAVKEYEETPFAQSANALTFKLMVPQAMVTKVIIYTTPVVIEGVIKKPSFTYTFVPSSSEYMEYIIPFDASGWALWNEAGKTIVEVANWLGIHQDDITKYFNKIEFYYRGNDGVGLPFISFIDSLKFVTLDNPKYKKVEKMTEYYKYTGETASHNTVQLDIEKDGDATATVLDLETPLAIQGKVSIEDKNITFSSNEKGRLTYVGTLVNGGQQIRCTSVSGELAETVGQMDMNAVQVLDNFDQYETDGTAYYEGNPDKNNRSGCRGAYYSEYYDGSSTTEWGGSGWSLMRGNGDQLKLMKGEGAHSGNQYLSLKNSTGNGMRYMQWGLFDGSSQKNSYRGSKLSFWAKTDGLVKAFKVSCYSQTTPRNATKDNYVRSQLFERTEAINEWEHFEIELNPNVVYYGFLVFMEKSYLASQTFLLIDDVEIYTASPYATYGE